MKPKLFQQSPLKSINKREEILKTFSPSKFLQYENNSKKECRFKTITTINNCSNENFISSKIKEDNSNPAKPKLIKGNLPSVINIIEKLKFSYDRINLSYKKINNSNNTNNLIKEKRNESPILKINEYASNTEKQGFKKYKPKYNNYFRETTFSPYKNKLNEDKNKKNLNSKGADKIIMNKINTNENGEEIDSKNLTNFSDFISKSLIRNKTITTNYSSVCFGSINENLNFYENTKFNNLNFGNNNLNKNKISNKYMKQYFGLKSKNNKYYDSNSFNKKYNKIKIEKKIISNNKTKLNEKRINIIYNERNLLKRSPSETNDKNNVTIEKMKNEILNYSNNNSYKKVNINNNDRIKEKIVIRYNSQDNKKQKENNGIIQINLNEGNSYKLLNGYKYHFNLTNVDIYLLKQIPNFYVNKIKYQINLWKNKYDDESIFLKIFELKINIPEGHSTIIIEHPIGGENLTDIINSIGFYDENSLISIISKLYKIIQFIQEDNYFNNKLFCLCDIFVDIKDEIKIIPPVIRNVSYICQNEKKCLCKEYLERIIDVYQINNNISLFCLGLAIIQLMTQNFIFKMKSFDNFINNKNNKSFKKCCLIHTLLNNEILYCKKKEDLLISNFLEFYPKTIIELVHECTDFNGKNKDIDFQKLIQKNENLINESGTKLKINELIKFVELPKNDYTSFNNFLQDFEILFKNLNINPDMFNYSLKKKKIISCLSRVFNIRKKELVKYFIKIIKNNDEKYY